jgi:hypothetical protein
LLYTVGGPDSRYRSHGKDGRGPEIAYVRLPNRWNYSVNSLPGPCKDAAHTTISAKGQSMRRAFATLCLAATTAVLGMALLAGPAFAGKVKPPTIKSVKFKGTTVEPIVVIKGTGLGSLPFEQAEEVPACFEGETATGNDFGTTVVFENTTEGWSAGEGAGDCIGLIFSTFTETEVIYHFGSAYSHYDPLQTGDSYTVKVNGLTKTGTAKVKAPKKPKK